MGVCIERSLAPSLGPGVLLLLPERLDTRVAAACAALVWLGGRWRVVEWTLGGLDELFLACVGEALGLDERGIGWVRVGRLEGRGVRRHG